MLDRARYSHTALATRSSSDIYEAGERSGQLK
jgi:hypothetical protein